jgi:arginase
MHGMPVSWLLGAQEGKPWWLKQKLSPRRLIYVGARDLDPFEKMLISELDISIICPKESELERAIRRELDRLDPQCRCPIHISLDVDALDATLVPSTGTPVPHGLTHAQVESIIDVLIEERDIVAMEVVEINPELGLEADVRELCAWARDLFLKVMPVNRVPKIPWQTRALRWWDL